MNSEVPRRGRVPRRCRRARLAVPRIRAGARASFLPPEMMDTAATGLAWFVIIVVPIAGIVLFWLVHVLPEKIAHKRHHPQRDAIHTLCLLSLAFGGLLWPIAWLWAYTKPVGYRVAYGTEKHEDYYHEMGEKAQAGELLEHELAHLREELDAMAAKGTLTAELKALRRDLVAAMQAAQPGRQRRPRPRHPARRQERLMEALLLGIYAFFVWLIFIKFKWLPWNTTSQVTVVIIPIVALAALILTLNVVAPSTTDVRVIKYVVQVDSAGARTRDRGAGRAQPAGEEGRVAVPHRPDPVPERSQRRQGEARRRRGEARAGRRGPGRCLGGRAATAGTAEVRQRTGQRAAAETRPRAVARAAEPGTGGDRQPATASRWNRPKPT